MMIKKQGTEFCNETIYSGLEEVIQMTDAQSIAIMLPIGAEGAALKYAVQAIDKGKNVITSFRSLPLSLNPSLIKFAEEKNVIIREISPRLDVIRNIFGTAPSGCTETLPKLNYKPENQWFLLAEHLRNVVKEPLLGYWVKLLRRWV